MSYYVRQQINKKGDTVYKIEVRYYDIVEKKQKSKTKLFIPPKNLKGNKIELLLDKEGKNFEETVMSIVNSNNPGSIKDMRSSFKEFAIRWLDNVKKEKGVTYYEDNVNQVRYLIEELGNYKLTDISPAIIQDLFNRIDSRKKVSITVCAKDNIKEILEKRGITRKTIIESEMPIRSYYSIISGENISEERAKGFASLFKIPFKEMFTIKRSEKSYAHRTNLQYKKVLALILGKAVKYGLVERNYATHEFIDFPSATKTKIDVMNEEEIKKFYDTITNLDNMDMKTALMLFLLSGFRRGEVCALKWSDIDFKNQTISINRSARKTKELGLIIKSPKTESSVRKITVPTTLINQLIDFKKYKDEKYVNDKKYSNIENYVFTNQYGDLYNIDIFEKWMEKALKKANLPHHSLHSLRHTNVTLQIAAGIPIVTVSSRVGHSKTSTTTDIYAYSLQGSDKRAALAIDNIFNEEKEESTTESDNEYDDFKKIKAEMDKYGIKSIKEYMEFKEFLKLKDKSITSPEKKDYN